LFKDTHITKLELLSNATTIDSALNFIRSKQQQQRSTKESQQQQSDSDNDEQQLRLATDTGKQAVF
jgi:hypothetical protein